MAAEYSSFVEQTNSSRLGQPIKSHWDSEQIIRRMIPDQQSYQSPLAPRPLTKVCTSYVTSQEFELDLPPSDDVVFTNSPARYRDAIDHESQLLRLDKRLAWGDSSSVFLRGDASVLPNRGNAPNSQFIQELSFPMACMKSSGGSPFLCRQQNDLQSLSKSSKLFNNATKQDRMRS